MRISYSHCVHTDNVLYMHFLVGLIKIDTEHTAWLVMHNSYASCMGIENHYSC